LADYLFNEKAVYACHPASECLHILLLYHTTQVVSSAIVDKYIGESARVIREMFSYAREHQPCVIFMDEIDAIGGRRFSEGTSADREIQRTLMELLSQLDGFDVVGKVRVTPGEAGQAVYCDGGGVGYGVSLLVSV
jgi:SpoVK/Ycf46/Vps4 family AAA+-type ATPase